MAHKKQRRYFKAVKDKFSTYFSNVKVIDVGSLDINGSNKELFDDSCFYIGVDLGPGKNVDLISTGHNLSFVDDYFDVVCCSEVFEHDMYYDKTLRNMYRMLRPGGLMFFSCATTGRPEHGTIASAKKDSPFTVLQEGWQNYYHNVTEKDVRLSMNIDACFKEYDFSTEEGHHDLRFWGLKQEQLNENINNDTDD